MGVEANVYALVGFKARTQEEVEYLINKEDEHYGDTTIPVHVVSDCYSGEYAYIGHPLVCIDPTDDPEASVGFDLNKPYFDPYAVRSQILQWYPELSFDVSDIKLYVFSYFT